jgi:hypothetical protein
MTPSIRRMVVPAAMSRVAKRAAPCEVSPTVQAGEADEGWDRADVAPEEALTAVAGTVGVRERCERAA